MVVRDAQERPMAFGLPLRMTGCAFSVRRPPPAPGEHSREVLAELGMDAETFDRLHAAGIV